ncbi:hypothetical protein NWO25_15045 [Enterococcus lactis]|nr:hypothetical protein [Enterococcus lactis]
MKHMGESGNRTESPIDPINGNRANGLATGKRPIHKKSNERPFRRFQTPSRKAAIKQRLTKSIRTTICNSQTIRVHLKEIRLTLREVTIRK